MYQILYKKKKKKRKASKVAGIFFFLVIIILMSPNDGTYVVLVHMNDVAKMTALALWWYVFIFYQDSSYHTKVS